MIAHWLLHYTGGDNGSGPWYLEWSGFIPDVALLPFLAYPWIFLRKHNCYVTGCKSVLTHNDPDVHAPACRIHHSHREHRRRQSDKHNAA